MFATRNNPTEGVTYLMGLCFLCFHLALFPVVSNLNAPTWAKGAGYAWLVVDNVLVVMSLNGVAAATVDPMRLGVHIAAATWILCAALGSANGAVKNIGIVTAVWIGGYSLVAPYAPPSLFYPTGLLLLLWCAVVGFTSKGTQGPTPEAAPTN